MRTTDGRRDPGPSRRDLLRLAMAAWTGPGLLAAVASGAEGQAGRIYALAEFPDLDEPIKGIIAIDPDRGTWKLIPGPEPAVPLVPVKPDGRALAYAVSPLVPQARSGVWIQPLREGAEPVRISTERCVPICWSDDGKQLILYTLGRPFNPRRPEAPPLLSQFLRVDADGSHRTVLPLKKRELVRDWSSDGRWLLINVARGPRDDRNPNAPRGRAFLARPDGTGMRLIHEEDRVTPGVFNRAIGFTPDGRRVTFQRRESIRGQTPEIVAAWTVDLAGEDRRPIPMGPDDLSFRWSPDGSRLAVTSRAQELDDDPGSRRSFHLSIMDADGGNRRALELPRTETLELFDWRPKPGA